MALDKAYFDAIKIEVVKKKYYNANKVDAIFADIRQQAQALTAENERLSTELSRFRDQKAEIGETLLSAKSIAQQILLEAQKQADEIVAAAQEKGRALEVATAQEELMKQAESCYDRVRERLLDCVEALNADWQGFLASQESAGRETAPADLEEKVDAIARELFALNGEPEIDAESIKA